MQVPSLLVGTSNGRITTAKQLGMNPMNQNTNRMLAVCVKAVFNRVMVNVKENRKTVVTVNKCAATVKCVG